MLDGKDLVKSSNISIKQNGDMYFYWQWYKIDHNSVAVYCDRNRKQVCMCCDTYIKIQENSHAIGGTFEALGEMDSNGVSDFLNKTLTGFKVVLETTLAEEDIILRFQETWVNLEKRCKCIWFATSVFRS